MQGQKTDIEQVANVLALHDLTGNGREVSRRTGIPPTTVYDILSGHGKWGEIAAGPVAQQLRAEQKSRLSQASRILAAKCLEQVEKMLPKASAYQAAGIYGLMRTHERLDNGESTENIALAGKIEAQQSDQLANRLVQRLVK